MSLIPRDSWSDFNRLFNNAFPSIRPRFETEFFSPRVDVVEKENAFEIIADLPGVAKEDVTVTCHNGTLTIEAQTKKEQEKKEGDQMIHRERYHGKMVRSFSLGDNINDKEIFAEFNNGELHVNIPKMEAQSENARTITIN